MKSFCWMGLFCLSLVCVTGCSSSTEAIPAANPVKERPSAPAGVGGGAKSGGSTAAPSPAPQQ
jgi:hypothetical protein